MKLATRFRLGKVVATRGGIQALKRLGSTLRTCCSAMLTEIGVLCTRSTQTPTSWRLGGDADPQRLRPRERRAHLDHYKSRSLGDHAVDAGGILMRWVAGLARARAQGRKLGQPEHDIPFEQIAAVRGLPVREAARRLGIPRTTLQRALARLPAQSTL